MGSGMVVAALTLGAAAAVAAVAAWLGRRIPRGVLLAGLALTVLFLLPGFASEKTLLPVDHAEAYPPWKTAGTPLPRNPNLNDAVTQFVPWAKAVRMAWKDGEIPWRNRWNGCGMALAGNGSSAPFSPLTLLMLALPLARAFTLAAAVKLLTAFFGAWLWLTELRLSAAAGLFGAAAFAFSFTMTPWLLFPQTAVIALWPWALFAIERMRDTGAAGRAFALLVGVFALWPLSGHLESAASGAGFAALLLGARRAAGDLADAPALLRRVGLAALSGAGLSAFALLPQLSAIAASNRLALVARPFWAGHLSWIPHGPAWPAGLWLPLFPRFFGDAVESPMRAGAVGAFPEMALGSIGLAAAAAALLTVRPGSRRARTVPALAAPLLVGLSIAVGQWPFAEIAAAAPGLRWMYPLRFFSWAALSGAALAAFEADRLARDGKNRAAVRALPLVLCGLSAAELLWQGRRLYAFGSPEKLFPDRPALAYLRAQPGPFRVVGEDDVLFPNTNVFAGLEDVRTHDPVERRDYVDYLDGACGYEPGAYFKKVRDLDCRGLDLLNVKYLVAAPARPSPGAKWKLAYDGPDATVFENMSVLPRVVGERAVVRDYRETSNGASFHARVEGADETLLAASFVSDGGWSARDGAGRALAVGRVPGAPFLTLRLPPGEHEIRLAYRPPLLREGAGATAATAALLAARALRRRRRGRVYGQVVNAAVS